MKIWLKKNWMAVAMAVICVANLLMWTPFNCFVAGVLLMGALNELGK